MPKKFCAVVRGVLFWCVVLVCVIVVLKKKREAVTSIVSRVLQRKFLFSSEFSVRVSVFVLSLLLKSFVWL